MYYISSIFTWLKLQRVLFHNVIIVATKTVMLTFGMNLNPVLKENILWFYCMPIDFTKKMVGTKRGVHFAWKDILLDVLC